MKLRIFLLVLLFLSIFIEQLLISIPLVFLFTYIIFSINERLRYLIPAAVLSIAGDAAILNPIGVTLILVCILILAIYLYAKYLGSKDTLVYILIGIIGIVFYAIIFGYSATALFGWFVLLLSAWIIYRLIPNKYSFL